MYGFTGIELAVLPDDHKKFTGIPLTDVPFDGRTMFFRESQWPAFEAALKRETASE